MMNDPHQMDVITDQLAKRGQSVCGDSFYYHTTDDYFICVLADGLGSGEYANEASSAVVNTVRENHDLDISTIMDLSNQSLLHKRGAAVGVIKINFHTKELAYCCTGNIRFSFMGILRSSFTHCQHRVICQESVKHLKFTVLIIQTELNS